jgi:hypothetical protein
MTETAHRMKRITGSKGRQQLQSAFRSHYTERITPEMEKRHGDVLPFDPSIRLIR